MDFNGAMPGREDGGGKMFAKVSAGILMGIAAAALCGVMVGGAVGGDESGSKAGLWTALAGFLVVFVLAVTATRGRDAWGRGLLITGLLCLLVAIVFSGIFNGQEVGRQAAETGRVGAAVVTVMAGTLFARVFAVLGFLFGLVFLAGSYLALRKV